MESLEGREYRERPFRICAEKVAEFVDVTGDDPVRWREFAPPGFAAVLLFVVAPELLADPRVDGAVVHGDQTFGWSGPLPIETDLIVSGSVDRVRVRGEVAFITFSLVAGTADEDLVEGRSTFLVGPSLAPVESEASPVAAEARRESGPLSRSLPSPRSASRADLVRYAAASRDWNSIHWDHQSAVDAGLGGVVVHGLYQAAWLAQTAALVGDGADPLHTARFRFTAPLRPGEAARVEGDLTVPEPELRLLVGDRVTVSARFQVEP